MIKSSPQKIIAAGHGLAVRQRAEEGAEGLRRFVPRAVAGLAVACVLSVAMPALAHQPGRDARLPTIGAAPAFALTTADGGRLALADLRGKVVAVTFIYATCTDTCPLLTAKLAGLGKRMGKDFGAKVAFVAITVDPERDTPDVLRSYAQAHGAARGGLGVPHRDAGGDQGRRPALRRVRAEDGPRRRRPHVPHLARGP